MHKRCYNTHMSHAVQPFTPRVVLGIAAHPDDLEFAAGGSITAWAKAGATVYYLILTNGNRGSKTDASPETIQALRHEEQLAAARILGVSDVFFAEYDDCCLQPTEALKKDLVRAVRHLRPDTVVTLDPTMVYCAKEGYINHPDHRAAGQAALDAIFPLARDRLSFPELITEEGLQPHAVATVLLFNLNTATFYVDITEHLETKLAGLLAHKSQFDTASDITARVKKLAKENGADCGAMYAESFVRIDVA